MRYSSLLFLNVFVVISQAKDKQVDSTPVLKGKHEATEDSSPEHEHKHKHKHESESTSEQKPDVPSTDDEAESNVPDWTQYTQGERSDWMKYMNKPGGENGSDSQGQFDWMKYAGPYMSQYTGGSNTTSAPATSADNKTEWNNGQGDGFGEPFRSQTGGDFRYKAGRDWNQSQGGWQSFAAPYSSVNPSQPGSSADSSSQGSQMDWQKYMGSSGSGGSGSQDWQKYMGGSGSGGSGSQDWQQYAKPYMGGSESPATPPVPQAGGYFEIEVSGKDLNVSTSFGLGQGHGGNSSNTTTGGGGGGGGNQNAITAKEGRIFIRGQFLNQLMGKDVVPAS